MSSVSVFTQFTITGTATSPCTAPNNVLTIDSCNVYCDKVEDAILYAQVKYASNQYTETIYTDDACTKVYETIAAASFDCKDGKSTVNGLEVACSAPVEIESFESFSFTGTDCGDKTVDTKLDTCSAGCKGYTKVSAVAGTVNGYSVSSFEKEGCAETATSTTAIVCLADDAKVKVTDTLSVACKTAAESSSHSSSSSSSVVGYSLVLLVSSALLNFLL
ncbi:expressed protein [Dictyostelium purpureum]|uniref:Expressed protein n=1 Tax=Dictyostelium purpureum TaxID=5786 RepID=F0ZAK7_DICPU|nr:uncharacterized protein DICPUDRAFT_96704 [Dictyostelium purpureum]EGC38990.1 expressed protein [Dictyostelium purpureum]|eukprot:XP_003284443.1 expressed protein [Dictyostelium purpureum]